jgi:hypothetical protein
LRADPEHTLSKPFIHFAPPPRFEPLKVALLGQLCTQPVANAYGVLNINSFELGTAIQYRKHSSIGYLVSLIF